MEISYIPIDKSLVPYEFTLNLKSKIIKLLVRYNSSGDFFTADIYDKDGDVIAYGKKFVIGVDLFESLSDSRLPEVSIIPYDETGQHKAITYENFMTYVKPYIFEVE
jgi:hypothetical protein